MSQTLYRKYRPNNFSEVIGQGHIVRTLSNAIKNNRVGQAYLFTGPRGTGKTSIARIFAKTINCAGPETGFPSRTCEKCQACQLIGIGRTLDIIEIDAASNTGVDNIRELKETVALPPTALKYKVYIIDEVHMLSGGAFNALLKTLEEPPSHVIFILATTEIHKVPETILSRCQRFDFTRLPIQNIIEKLSLIAKSEKIKIEKEALEMIAIAAEGGMRDAESLLGQAIALEDKNITPKEVREMLGTTDRQTAFEIAGMIIENDSIGAIGKINELLNDGYDLAVFNKSLVNYLRQLMLLKISPELRNYFSYEMTGEQIDKMLIQAGKTELAKIISALNLFLEAQNKISSSALPQLPLEIAVIKATKTFPAFRTGENPGYKNSDTQPAAEPKTRSSAPAGKPPEKTSVSKKEAGDPKKFSGKKVDIGMVKSGWNKLLEAVRPRNHSLQALLFSCQAVSAENNVVTLATAYDFYREKLNDRANKAIVEDVFGKVFGAEIALNIVTDKTLSPSAKPEEPASASGKQNSLLKDALEIMGGKIVEE